jgi:formylglycine-generating enzyme required for sulfatase activity
MRGEGRLHQLRRVISRGWRAPRGPLVCEVESARRPQRSPRRICLQGAILAIAASLWLAPPVEPQAPAAPPAPATVPQNEEFIQGDFWALIVGINEYPNLPPQRQLKAARPGAEAVARSLRQYGFERDRISQLYDANATRGDILGHIRGPLRRDAGPNDSILIYFAGHCQVDPQTRDVGWLPSDAVENDATSFILLKDLQLLLAQIPARHLFLVVDSCVGDGLIGASKITGDPTVREVYQKKSRWVLGGGVSAPQGESGKIGEFTQAFVSSLSENQLAYLTPLHLDQEMTKRLPPAANRTLRSGPMLGVGDDDGQFVLRMDGASLPSSEIRVPGKEDPRIARVRWEIEQIREMPLRQPLKEQAVASLQGQLEAVRKEMEEQRRKLEQERLEAIKRRAEEEARVQAEKRPVTPARPEDLTPMALVPAGEFSMGSLQGNLDERPQKRIHLDAFYIDKLETTVGRYGKYLVATGDDPPDSWSQVDPTLDSDYPVVGVDWDQATRYCKWAGKRLPTEAEWEKAARGTDGRTYPWGSTGQPQQFANLGKGGTFGYSKSLAKVGSYEGGRSPYEVYDMIGNVWEWTADWYDQKYYQTMPEKNPKGPEKGEARVIRGGSWARTPLVSRVSARNRAAPSSQTTSLGFRCAKDGP